MALTTIQTTIRPKGVKSVYLDGNIELGWFRMGLGTPDGIAAHPQLGAVHLQTFRLATCARVKDARTFRDLFHRHFRQDWARGDWFRNLDLVEALRTFDTLAKGEK